MTFEISKAKKRALVQIYSLYPCYRRVSSPDTDRIEFSICSRVYTGYCCIGIIDISSCLYLQKFFGADGDRSGTCDVKLLQYSKKTL